MSGFHAFICTNGFYTRIQRIMPLNGVLFLLCFIHIKTEDVSKN